MADSDSTSPDKKRQEPPPIEFLKPGQEQPAPAPQSRQAAAWVTRPEDYQRPQYAQPPAPPRTAQGAGNHAKIAGILLILAALVSTVWLLLNSLTPMSVSDYATFINDTALYQLNQVCSLLLVWGQAIMALGGIMAYQRLNWRMTVGCAFVSLVLVGGFAVLVLSSVLDPLVIAAALLGLVGFVLTVTAKDEFVS